MNANEWAEMTKLTSEVMQLIEKNRQQQAEIEALKKELALWRLSKSSEEIEATESDKFCDSHCVWTDHHPECKHAKYRR